MGDDIDTAERLARIETKLDSVLTILPNHDNRIREIELRKEECIQNDRLDKIDTRIISLDSRIKTLETINSEVAGGKKATRSSMEYVLFAFAVIEGLFIIWQAFHPVS